jgi:hypothetical protein
MAPLTTNRVLIITILRLKSLQLAVSSDFTYSKSYLGFLSALGCMLSIFLCEVIEISRLYQARKINSIRRFARPSDVLVGAYD